MNFYSYSRGFAPVCAAALLLFSACSGGKKSADEQPAFHADDDIAMVVRSLADAISVGEPLDSSAYNFVGVLTDGSGRPLYSDLQGRPGEWQILVQDSAAAVVRSTKAGDLDASDLQNYIIASLALDTTQAYVSRDFKGREQTVYDLPGGYLLLTSRADTLADGSVAQHLAISIRK